MKKLRTVSLEGLDTLSRQEKARLYGGDNPKVTISLPPPPPPVTFSISPAPAVVGSVTVKF
jgi:hypothetical protein